MKRTLLLHADLSRVIAQLGHGDMVVIGDAGLPIPDGPLRIDLAVTPGVPRLSDVLSAVLSEMQVEHAVVAQEALGADGSFPSWCAVGFPLSLEAVPHAVLKQRCAQVKAVVRTGECTPYANIILYSGVTF